MPVYERKFTYGRLTSFTLALALAAALDAAPLPAQSAGGSADAGSADEVMALSRLTGPVELDGLSGEAAWSAVPPLPMTMYTPTFGGTPSERTEIRVAYDDRYLYVSGRFYDSDPTAIRVNSMYRDRLSGDDAFGIVVDPFNDNDIALWFYTTPAGLRGDVSISGDGGGSWNTSWNTYWEAAAVETGEGWFAELRIPFSSLGFQATDGHVEMGISAYRYIPRKNERHVFPAIPPDFDYRQPSRAKDARLEGVSTHRPVYVTPYALGGLGQNAVLTDAGDGYDMDPDYDGQIGGDLKYNVTSNLTLDLTVNTDFAQVEADDQQVNLTRFSLFFPEKRQFFQERSGVFDFYTGGSTRLFYSRRIGIHEDEVIRILGGARLVGRIGEWDLGMLDMQTERSLGLPAENFGVLRVRRRAFNRYSNIGAMLTSRIGDDGSHNVAYGLDGVIRIAGDDYLGVYVAQSQADSIVDERGFRFAEASAVRVYLNRARARGLSYFFAARRFGADYEPGVGFIRRRDFSELSYSLAYYHYPEAGAFRRIDPFQLFGSIAVRNPDGSVESAFVEHDFDLVWRSGAGMGLDLELYYEDLREPLDLPNESFVSPGSYWFPRFEFDYSIAPGTPFQLSLGGGVQKFYDGWRANLGWSPRWYASRHLELNLQYQLDVVRLPDREQGFDAHIARLRVNTALDTKFSVNAFVQYSNASELAAANVRVRYNFREGNDLWLVYNEGLNLDRGRFDPALPLTDNRTVLLKYTHTLAW